MYTFATVQANTQKRINVNAKVVLQACSNATMVKHRWQSTSSAAMLGAEIAPRSFEGRHAQPVVTVALFKAIPSLARKSEPYTFSVTATLDGTYADNKISASTSLRINYVRLVNTRVHFVLTIS